MSAGVENGAGGVELSWVVLVDEVVAEGGRTLTVKAGERERAALAKRFGLVGIAVLNAEVRLRATAIGELDLRLVLSAAVTQNCVVTLEPVDAAIDDTLLMRFSRDAAPDDDEGTGGPDDPLVEAWPGTELDVGELVAQHLSLALNPYPRALDALLPEGVLSADDAPETEAKPNPFAVLREIRGKLQDP